jgi:hypothetical protein
MRLNVFKLLNGQTTEEPVYNMDSADVDGDGLLDLLIGVGGVGETGVAASFPGKAVLLRNEGKGVFQTKGIFPSESQAKGVKLADLDQDGLLDVLYTARASGYEGDTKMGKLYARQALGNWEYSEPVVLEAGLSAYYIEAADINHDGFPEIFVPNEHWVTVTYFLNPGTNVFSGGTIEKRTLTVTEIPGMHSPNVNDVRVEDFNRDGNPDVLSANLGTSTLSLFFGKGDGTFDTDILIDGGTDCTFLATGDLDSDEDLDIVVTHWTDDLISVFLNEGDGSFKPRADYLAAWGNYGVALADVSGRGTLDILTANYRDGSVSLLRGAGDGTFEPTLNIPMTKSGGLPEDGSLLQGGVSRN